MPDFKLTEEQLALQELARKFAKNEMIPKAAHHDQTGEFPKEVIEKAFQLGLINFCIPAEFGGLALSNVDGIIITEELSAGCSGMSTSLMVNDLALYPIVVAGTPEQKERLLRPFTQSAKLASFCLTEPGAGSDVAGLSTTLKKDGNGYRLNGQKMFITNANYSSQFTVYATMDPSLKHKGLCTVVVDAKTAGVSIGKKENKMGQRASDTASVHFDNV